MTPERLEELRAAYVNLGRRFASPPEADVLDLLDHVAEMESHLAKAKAEAWREGFADAIFNLNHDYSEGRRNPYSQEGE